MNSAEEYTDQSIDRYRIGCQQARVHGKFNLRHIAALEHAVVSRKPLWTTEQERAAEFILNAAEAGATAMLMGKPGNGKTYVVTSMGVDWTIHLSKAKGKARYWTMAQLFSDQKDWLGLHSNKTSPLRLARECGLLVIDEINGQNDSNFDQRELRELIDTRYRNLRPTILITNVKRSELNSVLDEASLDRLLDGQRWLFEMKSESRRQGATR